jgi:prepilin-type N-terminal cleavage/methylation domain-containing protein
VAPISRRGFTLIEMMIVLLVLGILLAIAVPNYLVVRRHARARACIANLKQIQAAKEEWAMDNRQPETATVPPSAIFGSSRYIVNTPTCPSTGAAYSAADIGVVSAKPSCPNPTVDGGTAPGNVDYHGMP